MLFFLYNDDGDSMQLLIYLAIIPSIILGWYIYKNDKVEKEPPGLLFLCFFGGLLSIILTLILSAVLMNFFPILDPDNSGDLIELFFGAFIGVAFIEELSKWVFLRLFTWNSKEFTHIYDGLVYAVFVSLGFATLENILYVLQGGLWVALVRAVLSVPLHAFCGVFMGYYYGLAKQASFQKNNSSVGANILYSLFFPIIIHGFFDYCLMTDNLYWLIPFAIFVIFIYIFAFKTVRRMSKIEGALRINYQPYVMTPQTINNQVVQQIPQQVQNNFCPYCGTPVTTPYCAKCGAKNL